MIIEPNCNLPWEIYLDWLADQGFDDLRNVDPYCFISDDYYVLEYHISNFGSFGYGVTPSYGGDGYLDYFNNEWGTFPHLYTGDNFLRSGAGQIT